MLVAASDPSSSNTFYIQYNLMGIKSFSLVDLRLFLKCMVVCSFKPAIQRLPFCLDFGDFQV